PPYSALTRHHSPRSTLFPYTTLFRSEVFLQARQIDLALDQRAQRPRVEQMIGAARPEHPAHRQIFQPSDTKRGQARRVRSVHGVDRKSTRLNSSHRTISYAVFCLKKK